MTPADLHADQTRALDLLIDEAARDLADASIPHDLAHRLKLSLAVRRPPMTSPLPLAHALPTGNVLLFNTAVRTRGTQGNRTLAGAALLHAAAVLLLALGWHAVRRSVPRTQPALAVLVTPALPPPPVSPHAMAMGGGGGQAGPQPVTHGSPPRFVEHQLVPPALRPAETPRLPVEPAVEVDRSLRMAQADTPDFGVANSPLVGISPGNGRGGGLGSGNGRGIGPGAGSNDGSGLRHIGGGVSAPVVLYSPEPEFSEEARKAKLSGNVLVALEVDQQGRATHVRVLRGIGMGLDEKALAAVRQYRFKPALENGKPVPVEMNIEVNFQIF